MSATSDLEPRPLRPSSTITDIEKAWTARHFTEYGGTKESVASLVRAGEAERHYALQLEAWAMKAQREIEKHREALRDVSARLVAMQTERDGLRTDVHRMTMKLYSQLSVEKPCGSSLDTSKIERFVIGSWTSPELRGAAKQMVECVRHLERRVCELEAR